MRYRRLLLFAIPITLALIVTATAWLLWPSTAITCENAAKIKEGMTLAEVEAILGGPAREESTGPLEVNLDSPWLNDTNGPCVLVYSKHFGPPWNAVCVWQSNRARVGVAFDRDERVIECARRPMRPVEQTLLDRIRAWLHL
jgi:hypothetical protein